MKTLHVAYTIKIHLKTSPQLILYGNTVAQQFITSCIVTDSKFKMTKEKFWSEPYFTQDCGYTRPVAIWFTLYFVASLST